MKTLLSKFTAILLLFAGVASSCNPDPEKEVYPKDISFTEYSLQETSCQWANLPYDEKVLIINSNEELKKYIACTEGSHPPVDFSTYTLLIASGTSTNSIPEITVTNLQQLSPSKYSLDIEVAINDVVIEEQWVKALIVEKVNQTSNVELRITLDMQIDFSNIDKLHEQPLPVIQRCIEGKWEVVSMRLANSLPRGLSDTYCNFDTKNNSVQVISEIIPDGFFFFIFDNFLQATSPFSYSWSRERKNIYRHPENPNPLYSTYVMQFDDEMKYGKNEYIKIGWIFTSIINDCLYAYCVSYRNPAPSQNLPFPYEAYLLQRITE